jgi:DNA-binding NtrC family response regulator
MNQQTVPKILVVEDEPLVRVNAAEMIEEAGWRALEAENSAEALRVLADHRDVAVLFTDINMPGDMDGLALADCVHKLHPQIELVVTSGKAVIADAALPDAGTFLRKPYGYEELTEAIERKLG